MCAVIGFAVGIMIWSFVIYKRNTGKNFFADLYRDVFKGGRHE